MSQNLHFTLNLLCWGGGGGRGRGTLASGQNEVHFPPQSGQGKADYTLPLVHCTLSPFYPPQSGLRVKWTEGKTY